MDISAASVQVFAVLGVDASSPRVYRSVALTIDQRLRFLLAKLVLWIYCGVEEVDWHPQKRRLASAKACKEDHVPVIVGCYAIIQPGEFAIHLHCSLISWRSVGELSVNEGPH